MSIDINSLPAVGGDFSPEDNELNEIMEEINQETQLQTGQAQPSIPVEAMGQLPPQPTAEALEQFQRSAYPHTAPQSSHEEIADQLQQLQQIQRELQGGSKFTKILREFGSNLKLILAIIISSIVLQHHRIQHFLTQKLIKIDFPYIDRIIIALAQVLFVILGKALL